MATLAVRSSVRPTPGPIARVGNAIWGLLTSVDFAVLQIMVLGLLAVVGMTLHQLPDFAFRSATDYANEMDKLHATYDPVLGTGIVSLLERLQLFHVFSSIWFSVGLVVLILSIVACTIDRTPRLWRQSADIRVVQPDQFYDPVLPERAVVTGLQADAVEQVLRRNRFHVRREDVGAVSYLYGDRNRWTKLATLLTHTGLVLFLVAAAVTTRFGDEQGLVVADGESLTVQPIGTPNLLLVRNLGFEAPGFSTGHATDFTTHLAVYQDGHQIADKVIRVNDPLTVAGYTFHQNGFGPAPDVVIRDQDGRPLWSGPIPMTDQAAGFPYADFAVPGRAVALQLLLAAPGGRDRGSWSCCPYASVGTNPDGSNKVQGLQPVALAKGEADRPAGYRLLGGAAGLLRLHAADRQARSGAGDRMDRLPVPHRGHRDHVLDAASPDLGAAGCRWSAVDGRARRSVRGRDTRVRARAQGPGHSPPRAAGAPSPRMTTLAEVLEALQPNATLIGDAAPDAGPDAPHVGWVRVLRARVPALDVLEPADLVIVPAAAISVVAPGPADVRDLIQTLSRSGASALLLVPAGEAAGPGSSPTRDVLAEAAAAAAEAGIPAVMVEGPDPGTLERRLIGFLVDRRSELERQAAGLESELAQLAMAGRGLDALTASIGVFLRRAVAIEGRRSDALAVHAPADVPGTAAAVGRLPRPAA